MQKREATITGHWEAGAQSFSIRRKSSNTVAGGYRGSAEHAKHTGRVASYVVKMLAGFFSLRTLREKG